MQSKIIWLWIWFCWPVKCELLFLRSVQFDILIWFLTVWGRCWRAISKWDLMILFRSSLWWREMFAFTVQPSFQGGLCRQRNMFLICWGTTLPPRLLQSARTAPRRTSYPAASGASTLIGSGTRATACATRQLLIGLSGQVVRVTSAPLRTVAAGRWGNSGERHRRSTAAVAARPSPGRHRAIRRLGAWMDAGQTSLGVSTWT